MSDDSYSVLEWVLGSLTLVFGSIVGYLFKTREKLDDRKYQESEIGRSKDQDLYIKTLEATLKQVDKLRDELSDNKAAHDHEMNVMRKTQDELREKITLLKANMLTMSMFGTDGPLAMWAKDLHGRRNWHNTQYEKMTGYMLSDCMLKTDLEITKSQSLADAWATNDDEVVRKGIYVVTIEPCVHRDRPKDTFYVIVIKWPRFIGSKIVGVDGAAHRLDEVLKAIEESKGVESV